MSVVHPKPELGDFSPARPLPEDTMLVLSRKLNESIIINDSIRVTIVEIRGDKIRLGIEAPANVPVHRSEIYEAIRRSMSDERASSPDRTSP